MADLHLYHRYRVASIGKPLAQILPEDVSEREGAFYERKKCQEILQRMKEVGVPLPPAPEKIDEVIQKEKLKKTMEVQGQQITLEEFFREPAVKPRTSFIPLEEQKLPAEPVRKGKRTTGRNRVSQETYDLRDGKWLGVEINIVSPEPEKALAKLVQWHIKEARKNIELDIRRPKTKGHNKPLNYSLDHWDIYHKIHDEGKTATQIAQERTGIKDDVYVDDTLKKVYMAVIRAKTKAEDMKKARIYPPPQKNRR